MSSLEIKLTYKIFENSRLGFIESICDLINKVILSDPTQVNLTSNFFVLCTNVKFYLYNY